MSNRTLILLVASLLVLPLTAGAAPKKGKHPKATSSITKRFKKIIEKNHRNFDRCEKAEVTRTKRKPKGLVLIRFVVNGDGKVTESGAVHNTTKSRALAECVLRNMDQLRFPASFGSPVTSSYSFKFNLRK